MPRPGKPGPRVPCLCPRCKGALVSARTERSHRPREIPAPIISFPDWFHAYYGRPYCERPHTSHPLDGDDTASVSTDPTRSPSPPLPPHAPTVLSSVSAQSASSSLPSATPIAVSSVSAHSASSYFSSATPTTISSVSTQPAPSSLPPASPASPSTTTLCSVSETSGFAGQQPKQPHHAVNPSAGISTRKPFEVPVTLPAQPPPVETARGSMSEKLMVASPTLLSARNLFARDYLKEHSPTKSEFKIVWDGLASETKKKYEAFSEKRKLAARLVTTTDSVS